MKNEKKITRLISQIQPRYLIAISLVIAAIMIISAVYELNQSKSELNQLMTEEATSLIEIISMSSSNAVLSNEEIAELISQRLLSAARMTAYIDSIKILSQKELEQIAGENNVFRINIFDKDGNKVMSSFIPDSSHLNIPPKHEPADFFQEILSGEEDEIIIGLKEARHKEGERFAVAVRRRTNSGGAIVVNVDAAYIIEFRKRIGFGKMIQDIGDNSGIKYILLQDEIGIIAASKSISEMSQIEGDDFLENAYKSNTSYAREKDFAGEQVFEVVKTLSVNDEKLGLLRLGLSMEQMDALESRMIRRVITLSIVLFIITVIVLSSIFVTQNLAVVKKEYEKVQSYSSKVIQNMSDALITTDKNGLITIFNRNAELLFDKSENDVIGKNINVVFGNEFKVPEEAFTEREELNNIEIEFRSPDKPDKILLVSTTKVYDENEETDSTTVVIRDITNIRNMEKQVQQHDKMAAMGELASGVAHEIRNPLNAISMVAQRYGTEFKPADNNEEYYKMTDVLLAETKRVNNIIHQFLRFARPSKLNKSDIKTGELINNISAIAETQCRAKGLCFEVNCECDVTIKVDTELMKQALLNLIRNAIEATEKGKVTLSVNKINRNLKIEVADTGTGIPENKTDKIFNLYYTTKKNGTGLGLSIVQQIISQHNGRLKVESKVNKGTKFIIELPLNGENLI